MNSGQGILVAVEGADGSGRGKQFELLGRRLQAAGHNVASFSFPRYDHESSYFVRAYLAGSYGEVKTVGPYTASLFYALDRYATATAIHEALQQGKIVLVERYVGSNMAHQGAKFRHVEERRGYFIWLDNLEFEMLRIPRPTISLVLHMPAELLQKQPDTQADDTSMRKGSVSATGLDQSAAVYHDLCQLFPRDFAQIDCARDGQLVGDNLIHDIVWQKVTPLLPIPRAREAANNTSETPAPQPASQLDRSNPPSTAATDSPASEQGSITLANVSTLLATHIASSNQGAYTAKQSSAAYYIPPELSGSVRQSYAEHMDQLLASHAAMLQALMLHLQNESSVPAKQRDAAWVQSLQAQARGALQPVLPLANAFTVSIRCSQQELGSLIKKLVATNLNEAHVAGQALLQEIHKTQPDFLASQQLSQEEALAAEATVAHLLSEHLPDMHDAGTTDAVQLVDVWPRNELELVAEIAYEQSTASLRDLRQQTSGWSYSQKADLMEAYLRQPQTTRTALEKVRYTWDILSSFEVLQAFCTQSAPMAITHQSPTPRYGYDIPPLVERAGLSDQFEACFDLSLRLHSLLQANGFAAEAQYAALLGHRVRWQASYAAYDLEHAARQLIHPGALQLLQRLQQKQAEVHPLLAEEHRTY